MPRVAGKSSLREVSMGSYRRVVAVRRGGPEVLDLVVEPVPEPALGEARVRVLPMRAPPPRSSPTPSLTAGASPSTRSPSSGTGVRSGSAPTSPCSSTSSPTGRSPPLVAERIPLAEARRAHELLGRGEITGKIVIVPAGPA
jgi:hypothetical protein